MPGCAPGIFASEMSKKIIKTIRAGRLVHQAVYPYTSPADEPHIRQAKQRMSSAARQKLNFTAAWQRLELLLAANFDETDWFVTLTYDDDHLPPDRDGAGRQMRNFLQRLRRHLRQRGAELRYVYNIEEMPEDQGGPRRVHHHAVIGGELDADTIRAVWGLGFVHVEPLLDGSRDGYEARARYLIKERHPGAVGRKTGLRGWTASRNLQQPEITTETVPDYVTLSAPPDAFVLDTHEEHNVYGEFVYLKYLTPPRPKPKRRRS